MGDLLATLRRRDFALLWFGGLISMAGDWMLLVALPIYVYQRTGSALATGAMFAAGLLPKVLFGSVAGVFVDRWDRKKTMVWANVLMALSVLPLLGAPEAGWLWVVYAVAFVQSCVGVFNEPAENSFLPSLVGAEHLVAANSLNAMNNNIARLAGPALAGLVVGRFGLVGVVVADVASYLVAAALIRLIATPARPERAARTPREAAAGAAASFVAVWREWLEGLRLVAGRRVILTLFVVGAVAGLGEGVMSALFPPFVRVALDGGAAELGWLMSAQAVGGLIGGVVVGSSWAAGLPPSRLLGFSAVLFGLIDLAIFVYPAYVEGIAVALLLFVLVGVPVTGFVVGLQTLLQRSTEDRYRGRVFGALGTTQALLMLIGALLGGALGDAVGIVPVLVVQGGAYVLAGLLVLVLIAGDAAAEKPGVG